jgi:hypothetical protein
MYGEPSAHFMLAHLRQRWKVAVAQSPILRTRGFHQADLDPETKAYRSLTGCGSRDGGDPARTRQMEFPLQTNVGSRHHIKIVVCTPIGIGGIQSHTAEASQEIR